MRNKIFFLLAALCIATSASAQNFLKVFHSGEQSPTSIKTENIQKVTFDDGNTIVTTSEGEQVFRSGSASLFSVSAIWQELLDYPKTLEGNNSRHNSFGYPSMMHIRDQYTQDLCETVSGGYNWWSQFASNTYQGKSYANTQITWQHSYNLIGKINEFLKLMEELQLDEPVKRGQLYAMRAFIYLDLARSYEYLPTDNTSSINEDGNDVSGLTAVIVTEKTTSEERTHLPRATRQEMASFIESDLDEAEKLLALAPSAVHDPLQPSLCVAYGLKARLYMWLENYAKAQEFAAKAQQAYGGAPMDETAWLDVNKGFNDASCWMWALQQTENDASVQSGIINWISWLSNQTNYSYTSLSTNMFLQIDRQLYERIPDTDFRKQAWVSPNDRSKNKIPAGLNLKDYPNYVSLKFRPNMGNIDDSQIAGCTAIPLMRVEEMMLIEAEAAAHGNPEEGCRLLNNFVRNYRDPNYNCTLKDEQKLVEEIIFQKRVELWGEGQTFFDIKRLNYSVTRGYKNTNHVPEERFNTHGRPAWMNMVIMLNEEIKNEGVTGFNNPDPTGCYELWDEQENEEDNGDVNDEPNEEANEDYNPNQKPADGWQSIGTCYWTDGIIGTLFNIEETLPLAVEAEMRTLENGDKQFRFLSPYCQMLDSTVSIDGTPDHVAYIGYPYNEESDLTGVCDSIVITVSKQGASIAPFELGINWGYGAFSSGSIYDYITSNIEKYPLGKVKSNANNITVNFSANSLYVSMTDYNGGGKYPCSKPSLFTTDPNVILEYSYPASGGAKYIRNTSRLATQTAAPASGFQALRLAPQEQIETRK